MNPSDFYPNSDHNDTAPVDVHQITHSPMEQRMFPQQAQADRQRVQEQELQAHRQTYQRDNRDNREPMGKLSEEQQAQRLYQDSPIHGDAQRETVNTMTELGWTPEDAQEAFDEAMPIFEAFGASATESATAAQVAMSIVRSEPSPALVETWVEASRAAIAQDYGQHRIGEVLRITQEYVNGIPEARDMLMGALGNHPTLVRMLARKAMDAKRGAR